MATSKATTVSQYLAELPANRRRIIIAVRKVIKASLPAGYKEAMGWGMICYSVPLSVLPDTYNGQPLCYAALAAQKQYCSLYLMNVYSDAARAKALEAAFAKAGKKLDMGKSCVRFQTPDDLPLDVIAATIAATPMAAYVAAYKAGVGRRKK
jgi:uncharacterized protein YdhG (YjbR/CyaY superfamily)